MDACCLFRGGGPVSRQPTLRALATRPGPGILLREKSNRSETGKPRTGQEAHPRAPQAGRECPRGQATDVAAARKGPLGMKKAGNDSRNRLRMRWVSDKMGNNPVNKRVAFMRESPW